MRLPVRYALLGEVPKEWAESFVNIITEDDWKVFDFRKKIVPASSERAYDSLVFRYSPTYSNLNVIDYPLYSKYKGVLKPFIGWCSEHFEIKEWVSFAARLRPNEQIKPHVDAGEFLETIYRLHFPILTNSDAFYVVEDERVHMPVGSCYEIDNQRMHWVENNGVEDRIHLVINIYGTRKTNLTLNNI